MTEFNSTPSVSTADARMVCDAEELGIRFEWHGGAYIEFGPYFPDAGEFQPQEVINVWDCATDEPRIERSLAAFQSVCEAKVEELRREWEAI